MPITNVKIFPSIGIARLGNSSTDFFIGPELPGVRTPPPGGYKDASCHIKRQAARFRIFGFDGPTLVQEITNNDATIEWTVELANTKASWRKFGGLSDNQPGRNGLSAAQIGNFPDLEIRPGPRTLTGPNQAAGFNTGRFLGKVVPLGEMRTDAQSRLLVLGGFGRSESLTGTQIVHYANNDGWHDDVSDGPVTAKVILNGEVAPLPISPAWVLCVPPDFAPPVDSITTLYDVLFQVAVDKGWLSVPAKPSFTNDIWPILQRVFDNQRTSGLASSGHADFNGSTAAAMSAVRRSGVFDRLRDPNNPSGVNSKNMPQLYDDSNGSLHVITKAQYQILSKWKGTEGTDWTNDWPGAPPPPPANITPDGLTRAALEASVGAAFFPGIEASWFLRDLTKSGAFNYTEMFRLDPAGHGAGDVTKQMAVPWQADFWKCQAGSLAWWPAQRPDDVFPEAGGGSEPWTRDIVNNHQDMVDNWHKLGFVVNKSGSLVETERRKACTSIFLVTDRSSFSDDEVSAVLSVGSPAQFPDSLYVIAEGFKPADLGLNPGVSTATYTPATLQPIAPSISLKHLNNATTTAMTAPVQTVLAEVDPPPANQLQRFTFVYRVDFTGTGDFLNDLEPITATATKTALGSNYSATGNLTLFKKANPYMVDGATSWLSLDVRVFKLTEGQSLFGIGPIGNNAAAALSFIGSAVGQFRTAAQLNHPFDTISVDPNVSQLELAEEVNQKRVFNFAVARVRYKGNLGAPGVRVFFRLFTVAATGVDYDETSTYRRTPGATPISLLGLQANKIVTIPCYGAARIDTAAVSLTTQTDPLNAQDLLPLGANEFQGYFGCWLDFNQQVNRFPVDVGGSPDGPWAMNQLKSVQELIRGLHQCLVAEVFFQDDPIVPGISPANSDNLAQRNLVVVESANPGVADTRTVQHTFELKATRPASQVVLASDSAERQSVRLVPAGPDELMIRWGNLPRTTRVSLYMPDVDANEVLKIAGQNYEANRLERIDDHTVLCHPGDVTYVPLPSNRNRNIAALVSLELPEGVKRDQRFNVFFHQISGRPRKIIGAFQMTIPVSVKSLLLDNEVRRLSVLRHIALAIPAEDQWHAVFTRYLGQIADRVEGFGGDPDSVAPSPTGSGVDLVEQRCKRRSWIFSLLLALLFVVAGLHLTAPPSPIPEIIIAVAMVAFALYWIKGCAPSRCQILNSVLAGLVLSAAILALLILTGIGSLAVVMLAVVALLLGVVMLLRILWRCF